MRKIDVFSIGYITGAIVVTLLLQATGQIHLW